MDYESFLRQATQSVQALPPTVDVLGEALRHDKLQRRGTWVEFGVAKGETLQRIAASRGDARVWGFDSFDGLPEDWKPGWPKGTFAMNQIPRVPGAHLVTGLFHEVLPAWMPPEPVTFVHIDCDLYSAAKCALSHVRPMLADGAIIAFDELLNYPGFEKHEMLALYEVTEEAGLQFEWLIAGGGPDPWLSERAAILVHSRAEA